MTSLEIAELTGKQHKNLMQTIRNMEPAWEKVHGLKFQLMFLEMKIGNSAVRCDPCYQLTKAECLYIATKFNDEWWRLSAWRSRKMLTMCVPVSASACA